MDKIKLVVVGPGLIGKKHIDLILKHPRCELAAIVAPETDENLGIARELNVAIYGDLYSVFRVVSIDGVIISSPNIFHVQQATECILKNIPVLVEKPIAHTYAEGLMLMDLADKHKAKILVGHHRTYSSIIQVAQKIIQDGRLGSIVSVMGSALFYKPDQYFLDGPWRSQSGGGPILINLIHEIGNLRALCGEISSVQAMTSNKIRSYPVEDTVAVNFCFESGALGVFLLSDTASSARSWEQTAGENPAYPRYKDEDCYTVSGTKGSLAIPSMRLKYFGSDEERSWWKPFKQEQIVYRRCDPLKEQLNHFVKVIEGLEEPRVTAFDGLQNLKVIEAITKSAELGTLISVY
jgi:predicted dehydrogenase